MSVAGEAKSWFEGVQQILGMSIDRMFGMIAPAVLAGWFLSVLAAPDDGPWPTSTPFQWLALVSDAAGVPSAWATNTSEWIGARGDLYAPCLIAAAVLTGLANVQRNPTAFLGLAAIVYAVALELHNSPLTLGGYLIASATFCVLAIITDATGDSYFSYFSGYLSFPSLSFRKWLRSISVVAFSWFTIPFFIIAGAIEGYRIEQTVIPAPPTGAAIRALKRSPPR